MCVHVFFENRYPECQTLREKHEAKKEKEEEEDYDGALELQKALIDNRDFTILKNLIEMLASVKLIKNKKNQDMYDITELDTLLSKLVVVEIRGDDAAQRPSSPKSPRGSGSPRRGSVRPTHHSTQSFTLSSPRSGNNPNNP